MFNRLVKYFLENRLITFILLITFVVLGFSKLLLMKLQSGEGSRT